MRSASSRVSLTYFAINTATYTRANIGMGQFFGLPTREGHEERSGDRGEKNHILSSCLKPSFPSRTDT